MKRLPTDRQVVMCIYEMYRSEYPGPTDTNGRGTNDPYVPINLHHAAGHLACSPEILFGRLYYHLTTKYSYQKPGGAKVELFVLNFQGKKHCVQFPLLTSVLAALEEDDRRQRWAIGLSIAALAASIASILVQVLAAR